MNSVDDKLMVTIIVPAYNAEKYLKECLTSCCKQDYKNYEILIINDGSTDNTEYIVKNFQRNDKRIRLVSTRNNGQGKARNIGITLANGTFILFVDADDYIEPNTISKSVRTIEKDQSDIVIFEWDYSNSGVYRKNGHLSSVIRDNNLEGKECLRMLEANPYFTVNALYRKNFLLQNCIKYAEGHIYEDYLFYTLVAIYSKKISLLDDCLYHVRLNTDSTTKSCWNTDKHFTGFLASIDECIEAIDKSTYTLNEFYYLYKYWIVKFQSYLKNRVPKHLKKDFKSQFVFVMSKTKTKYRGSHKLTNCCYKYNVFARQRYYLFFLLIVLKNLKKILKGVIN